MALQQVRFLHSSDWLLEFPIGGVPDVPAALREPFVDASYQAAERVVQSAIDERVDFLLLTGNTLKIESACPYTFEFMLRQFQRLGDEGISVYWLGGEHDDMDLWPAQLDLPKHVTCFPISTMQRVDHRRDGKKVASIVGQSWRRDSAWRAADYQGTDESTPRIAACFGPVQKRNLENKGVQYWALGGRPDHQVVVDSETTAIYPGSPQGRFPQHEGEHGAVLVDLDFGRVTTRLIETDMWRWRHETVGATDVDSIDALKSRLLQQLNQIQTGSSRCSWLICWNIACTGKLAAELQPRANRDQLLNSIQKVTESDSRWSLALETQAPELPDDWYEEDSILGDFLRSVRRYESDAEAWQELLPFLPEGETRESMISILRDSSANSREQLWRQVASWGADLLQGNATVETQHA